MKNQSFPLRSTLQLSLGLGLIGATVLFAANPSKPSAATSPAPVESHLGAITFPNSGSAAAQPYFLRGVAALHSFWYEEAREAFQEASKVDPSFALAYWGEALTWNHSLWQFQDRDEANAVLKKIPADAKTTPRERAYLAAARILFGEGEKLARDYAYADALEKIYAENPKDEEATAFYALAILGTTRNSDYGKGYARQVKAGALVFDLYKANPNHPGAAHYIIHAFDDPEHAILALPAARRYAEIAPEAHHAQHMPSHIFLQLGMWDDAARSNQSSWAASVKWVESKRLFPSLRDFHSYHWLTYIYLQQGRRDDAFKLLRGLHETYGQYGPAGVRWNDDIAAAYVIETQSWADAEELLAKPKSLANAPQPGDYCGAPPPPNQREPRNGLSSTLFARAFAAANRNAPEFAQLWRDVEAERPAENSHQAKLWEISSLVIKAAHAAAQERYVEAIAALDRATLIESQTAKPNGPPRLIKPSHEFYGEVLLRAGRPQEAVKQFEIALSRQSGRALSLVGLARAQAQAGNRVAAAAAYRAFADSWHLADASQPALQEARLYLQGNPGLLAAR